MIKRFINLLVKLFCGCFNCKYSLCSWDGIPDWQCKKLGTLKDTEPNNFCNNWRPK
jgi:hypothetical protein